MRRYSTAPRADDDRSIRRPLKRGRYHEWELPALVLGLVVETVGLVLTFVGDRDWGWMLVLGGVALVFVVARRVMLRTDAAAKLNKQRHWSDGVSYRDGSQARGNDLERRNVAGFGWSASLQVCSPGDPLPTAPVEDGVPGLSDKPLPGRDRLRLGIPGHPTIRLRAARNKPAAIAPNPTRGSVMVRL